MKRHMVLSLIVISFMPVTAHDIMIDINELPLVIDTYARYRQNSATFRWAAFDSTRRHWNLTQYPQQLTTRTGLRDYDEGVFPAPDSMEADYPEPQVVEFDTLGNGTEQTTYFYLDSFALWCDGLDFEQGGYRFLGNYRPDGEVYNLPMYFGSSWMTAWSWRYEIIPGIPYVANEQHEKRIVARGKVMVPMSGDYYWPCLVIKDYMTYSDNMGSNDRRWIYEWVVPAHFAGGNGVAAAMSQNGAAPNFVNVENLFQMQSCSVPGWDLRPPTFANATVWRDTAFAGPFVIASEIRDDDAVGAESVFYRVNQGAWQSVPADSNSGAVYWFTIPQVTPPTRIDYYVWAMDDFCVDEEIEFWTTWPVCSPESTMITFIAGGQSVEQHLPSAPSEVSICAMPNPFGRVTTVSVANVEATSAICRVYSVSGELVRQLELVPRRAGALAGVWDGRDSMGQQVPAGAYLYEVTTPGWHGSGRLLLTR